MKNITNGSEKQIAWAEEIKATNIRKLERELEEYKLRAESGGGEFPQSVEKIKKALHEIKTTEKSAKFWIDNQGLATSFIQRIKK